MIKLYGITQSRAFRPLWLLHELGLPFEHVKVDFHGKDLDDPGYRALNPNGRIPTLIDGDLVLWESMAINLYLARKYGRGAGLWPDTIEDEARALQWSFWVMSEVESALLSVLMHSRVLPADRRDPEKVSRNRGLLKGPFSILDQTLADHEFLAGNRFTVADLNVAAVLSWCKPARLPLADYPHLDAWLRHCLERPARKAAQLA
ncbi:MAG: glutathione S-transferase family protein [Gammaproteobacteria bacterium]|nr:glutathione S-transferase family protein [Gammaproteobacteria bacterium]MCP5317232.1 glutathione S-transferase family protein [Chromatiaceae bacterium]MCW5586446.1 glutathione S-transferase family protein [Chromatiales bacterium]MCB1816475.1 glutathione S-transferase family protein [Gammaproteobacteria bacterium]HOP15072.1 glutathione S-transferase family protein [Gammaproteobacteria bacterium]